MSLALLLTQQSYSTSGHILILATPNQQALRAVEPQRFFQTQAQRVLSDGTLEKAARSLNNGTSTTDLRIAVKLDGGASDDILRITATGNSPQQSSSRARAVVQTVISADNPEVATELLWVGEPEPALPPDRLVVGCIAGGILLGGVLVLIRGVTRRPILGSHLAGIEQSRVDVYQLGSSNDVYASCHRLLDWVSWSQGSNSSPNSPTTVGIVDLAKSDSTKRIMNALTDSVQAGSRRLWMLDLDAEVDRGRPVLHSWSSPANTNERMNPHRLPISVLLLVGEEGKTTEFDVESQVRWFAGVARHSILVLTDGKNGGKS